MIVNPDTFQAMVLQKQDKNSQTNSLNIDSRIIETIKPGSFCHWQPIKVRRTYI